MNNEGKQKPIKNWNNKKNFKLYFNSLLYVAHTLGLQELNEIYIIRTMRRTYEVREVFWKV